MSRKSQHPAIVALRKAHAAFATAQNCATMACYASDLVVDEKFIKGKPDAPFGWVVSKYGTHLVELPSADVACYALTRTPWPRTATFKSLGSVLGAFDGIPYWMFTWDGATLRQWATDEAFRAAVASVISSRSVAHLRVCLEAVRSDEAMALHWGTQEAQQRAVDARSVLESEAASVSMWGAT